MPAFNARLRPKELFGLPLVGVISGLVTLACGFMAMTIPLLAVKILLGVITVLALFTMFVIFALGDELAFVRVRLLSKKESQDVTYEVGREQQ